MMRTMRIAQLQTHVYPNDIQNIHHVTAVIEKAMTQKPDLVMLGEMFACPYDTACFPAYAQREDAGILPVLGKLAASWHIYLAAGSVPELGEDGKIYNTAYVFDREGKVIAKHRKMHLFDVDIQGGQYFKESDTLTPGNQCTVFDTEFGRMGLCICFDIRFPELARLMALQGARLILVPAAFNSTTGPAHWELLFRARALDNQCFVAGTSVARDDKADYKAWGHSILVSPWGEIIDELDEKNGIMVHDIDLSDTEKVRCQLPVLRARRTDLYELKMKEK